MARTFIGLSKNTKIKIQRQETGFESRVSSFIPWVLA